MKRSKPKILVAVMSYERPDALEVCLTSLVEVGGEFSVVIVDDRSSNKFIPDLADRFGFEYPLIGTTLRLPVGTALAKTELCYNLILPK